MKMHTLPPVSSPERPALARGVLWKAIAALGAVVFVMFADMLVAPGPFVLGNKATDMFQPFFSWRAYGFDQLRHGNLALWNPHIYGGAPFFGGMQEAMLYPVNFLLLLMPAPLAINWTIAVNIWLLGAFMYLWAGYRGLRPLACFVAGVLLMFCGPHFIHLYAGHPVNMATMTWVPLLFLAIDGILARKPGASVAQLAGWCLLGMFAVAMQIFAGHPQYLFYTGVTAGLYLLTAGASAFTAQRRTSGSGKAFLSSLIVPGCALAAIYTGGVLLAAIQLFATVQAMGESVRTVRVPFEFASMFAFPPENLLTLLNPYFFGDMVGLPYWGRCYLWEMSLFIGVTGLALAIYGACHTRDEAAHPARKTWILLALATATFVLALGVHTPLFRILYDYVPGFGKFRGISKFTFQSALFLILLAATGFDALLRKPQADRRFVIGVAAAGGLVLLLAGYIGLCGSVDWREWMRAVAATRESYLNPAAYENLAFADSARAFAARALLIPGFTLLATAALLRFATRSRYALPLLAALALIETFVPSLRTRDSFDSRIVATPEVKEFVKNHPGDYRILNLLNPSSALDIGTYDMWGYDPIVARRHAELMAWTQGIPPDNATQYVNFQKFDPLYAMLRLRYVFVPEANGMRVIEAPVPPLERVQLVPRWRVIPERDAIFEAMHAAGFDPRKEVILETAPAITPGDGSAAPGTARITASSTDWLEVEADAASPCILLVTDVYTPAWRAVALPGSSQSGYQLQPANYALRAVPLAAGHHHLRIVYAPREFIIGKWISIGAWLAFLGTAVILFLRKKRFH